ncbi:uncharacterized protein K441DRAFT_430089, partial [Cenococcum geophilum 1.58]|uniref:uncharacterized protein n=1 Tax=Cenococcum geophilum 1.58 TaxID=794803 RepID=UPI000DC964D2
SSRAIVTTRLAMPIYCAMKAYINHFVRASAELDQKENIRVVAVAPGMIRTPLWFRENPDKLKSVGEGDIWIEPSEITEVLLKLCEDQAYKDGTVLEASGQGRTRVALVLNDPGSSTVG